MSMFHCGFCDSDIDSDFDGCHESPDITTNDLICDDCHNEYHSDMADVADAKEAREYEESARAAHHSEENEAKRGKL